MMINLPSLNLSLGDFGVAAAFWGWWWPTSPSTGASLYHADLLNAWCRLSRVPLTHLDPYSPLSRSLENGEGKSNTASFFDFHPSFEFLKQWNYLFIPHLGRGRRWPSFIKDLFFQIYVILILLLWSQSVTTVCVYLKGRIDKKEVWANSVAACHDRKQ